MKKRPVVGLISTSENTGAQIIDDTTAKRYWFVQTSAGGVKVLGPIPYGKTIRYTSTDPQREVRQEVMIGGDTVEVVVASERYAVAIWCPDADYETHSQSPNIYAYTAPAALTGTADTDRYNLYYALAAKINAYAGNNVTAYLLYTADYTLGSSPTDLDTNFIVGETVTQATSLCTAKVAKCTITSGTFAADNAAGKIYLYDISDAASWLATAVTLTAAGHVVATNTTPATSNCVVTQTVSTTLVGSGLYIKDDAGYYISTKSRGGISRVSLVDGFATATAVVTIAGKVSLGIGTDMLARRPYFEQDGSGVITGELQYDFSDSEFPVAGQAYQRIVLEVLDGDELAIDASKVESVKEYILWFNDSNSTYTTALLAALDTVIAK